MQSKTPSSGGELIVKSLESFGVRNIFCVPGESYLPILDALYQHSSIKLITCRQEGGASYMAEAYSKATGQPGICLVSRGPGATNAMIGVHTAFQDSTPMILLIGQVHNDEIGREAFQELDYQKLFSPVAKEVIRIDRAHQITERLRRAWHTSLSGRPGPVVIEMPENMLKEMTQASVPQKIPSYAVPSPSEEDMTKFHAMLSQCLKPILIVGGAGWCHKASEQMVAFAEQEYLPVVTAFRRNDHFDNTNMHYAGELSTKSNPKLIERIQKSDLIIAIGCRLGEITTAGYSIPNLNERIHSNPKQKLIHIHIDINELERVYPSNLSINSSPINFLQKAIIKGETQSKRLEGDIISAHKDYLEFVKEPRYEEEVVRMDKITAEIRKILPADAIITNGAGNYSTWAMRHYQFREFRTHISPTNGSMGYGVPAAIAAKIAHPEKTVISFSGDGCFMMNGQELATAVHHNISVIFIIINNNSYKTILDHQEKHYPSRTIGTDLSNPNFVKLAESYGARGIKIKQTEDFKKHFIDALTADCPVVFEIETNH